MSGKLNTRKDSLSTRGTPEESMLKEEDQEVGVVMAQHPRPERAGKDGKLCFRK